MARIDDSSFLGEESIGRILLKIAPPVMAAQLIQAFYNIADSYFIGGYSNDALTALSVIYPIQLLIIAFATGTGVGVNTLMAKYYAIKKLRRADETGGTGMVLSVIIWAIFALLSFIFMESYVCTSASSLDAIEYAVTYGNIVCIGSIGSFLEGNWTKVHQSHGNMRLPMIAQIAGALTNIILDPVMIYGFGFIPEMGVTGAGWATVIGQCVAAFIVAPGGIRKLPKFKTGLLYAAKIYKLGYPSILMQALYTVYIVVLNVILAEFSDAAVTVLGLYYKMQTFFFIPLMGLQVCIVLVLSYNYTCYRFDRCKKTMNYSFIISAAFMLFGIVCFVFFPKTIMGLFSSSAEVMEIGSIAFPIIGTSFISAVFSLILPVFFQAIGNGRISLLLSLTRQIFCLMPIFWLLSLIGLNYTWLAYPISETIAGGIGLLLYKKVTKFWD